MRRESDQSENISSIEVYLWILSFTKKYRVALVLFILCQVVNSIVHLSVFKFLQYFIDYVLPEKNIRLLIYMLVGISLAISLMFVATILGNALQRTLQEKTSRDIQISVFDHLRKLGLPYFEEQPPGRLLSMFNSDVASIQRIYKEYIPSLLQTGTLLALSFIALLTINYRLILILLPIIILYYLVNPLFERRAAILGREVTNSRMNSESKIFESIAAIPEVRSYGTEDWDLKRIMDKRRTFNAAYFRELINNYIRGSINIALLFFGLVFLFVCGAFLVKNHFISVGELVASTFFYFQAITSCTSFVNTFNEQRMVLYQAESLYKFCKIVPGIVENENPISLNNIQGELTFKNVYFQYNSRRKVINGFNLHVPIGKKIALVGESGGGKSTILKLIGRLYDPSKGEILIDKVPLSLLSINQLRENVGYVFQETYLFGGTIAENICFGNPRASDEEIIAAAKAAYLHQYIIGLPNGYKTIVGERGIKLSGGQKQRIAIARMFLKNPSIILLDEATSALDNISEIEIKKALDELFKGRTIIAVAHRITTVKDYDEIVVIDKGRIIEKGSYEVLLKQGGKFYQLVHSWSENNGKGVSGL
ncbi:ABC transporter ATP-binding protein [Bacillus wiedmannii]|uniref:ABC transporter ATP-binding protein n=1 Tax=Bacillus wiedmannii TaxID=1890302 RepID=UPI000BF1BF56|nr:ABC transporter ATP-binding protein [Bacillus wiedmannii]PEL52433.1 ABC transporter [Bacillus wiedmannii]PEO06290.1 ABC transporter [Bacillus wiedmannii]PEQ00757.1 ABC transporter [Bacillus wiedmannii]